MASPTERSTFRRKEPAFFDFLAGVAKSRTSGSLRQVAENFAFEEALPPERVDAYVAELRRRPPSGDGPDGADAWQKAHSAYFQRAIDIEQGLSTPSFLDEDRPETVPETFLVPRCEVCRLGLKDRLIRVERVERVARVLALPVDALLAMASSAIKERTGPEGNHLGRLLAKFSSQRRLWPVFAGLWRDHEDLFPDDSDLDLDVKGWPDILRDRLGLLHLNPAVPPAGPIPVFVFRYPIEVLPRQRRLGDRARPVLPPTVLDTGLGFPAFFPAPEPARTGFAVKLAEPLEPASCEVLHPFIPYDVRHLFRVGTIAGPPAVELGLARSLHMDKLREATPAFGRDLWP